jgi:serine/threonine protein kinase
MLGNHSRGMKVDADTDLDSQALPIGVHLEEFEILGKIGDGGFSIVYRAWDRSLEREVALKEYLPSSIAFRGQQTQVGVRSERNRQTFEAGLASFVREAQTLASFNHPGLVRVFRFFLANGTAYMAMPLYLGRTLRTVVDEMVAPPDEAWLMNLLHPLMDVLETVHAQDWYHRDIAPDNIMLVDGESRPILLDFGAARQVVGDMTQALTVVLKPGYAPIEQYAAIAEIKQGPWTDVYALAATIHWVITGKTPPIAAGRILQDSHIPLAISAKGRYTETFLSGLDAALKVKPVDRTQNVAQFRNSLAGSTPTSMAHIETQPLLESATQLETSPTVERPRASEQGRRGQWAALSVLAGCAFSGLGYLALSTTTKSPRAILQGEAHQPPLMVLPSASRLGQDSPKPPIARPKVETPPVSHEVLPASKPTSISRRTESNPSAPLSVAVTPQPERKTVKSRTDVCDDLLRKLSLGDADPDLARQIDTNNCAVR